MPIMELLQDLNPEAFVMEEYESALVGLVRMWNGPVVAAYSAEKIIDMLAVEMGHDNAVDYFHFNIEGAYVGENTPLFVFGTDLLGDQYE